MLVADKLVTSGLSLPDLDAIYRTNRSGARFLSHFAVQNLLYLSGTTPVKDGQPYLTGVVGKVVYGGFGKDCAGAPSTPAKTWFHTAFDHPPMLLSRTRNCCWDPLMTNPVLESARKPPLAYCGPAVQ